MHPQTGGAPEAHCEHAMLHGSCPHKSIIPNICVRHDACECHYVIAVSRVRHLYEPCPAAKARQADIHVLLDGAGEVQDAYESSWRLLIPGLVILWTKRHHIPRSWQQVCRFCTGKQSRLSQYPFQSDLSGRKHSPFIPSEM